MYLLIAFESDPTKPTTGMYLKGYKQSTTLQNVSTMHIFAVNKDTWQKVLKEIDLGENSDGFRTHITDRQFGRIEMLIENSQ